MLAEQSEPRSERERIVNRFRPNPLASRRRRILTRCLPFLVVSLPAFCNPTSPSFVGTFTADNQEQVFDLTLASQSTVQIRTWSYGGGIDAADDVVPAGGFAPELSIFDSAGDLIALDAFGGVAPTQCNGRNIDAVTGFCFDAVLNDSANPPLTLLAGLYTVVLTEQGNNPVGMFLDGFSEDAAHGNDPSFTGTNAGIPDGVFLDPGNFSQRTGSWEVDFTSSNGATVTALPEPSSRLLALSALLLAPFIRRRVLYRRLTSSKA